MVRRTSEIALSAPRRAVLRGAAALAVLAALPRHALAGIEDTIARVKPSIVAVGTLQPSRNPTFLFSGTGFAVGDGSLIATNAHVIPRTLDTDRRETLVIALPNRTGGEAAAYPARVVAIDREYDLAVIAIEGKRLPALQLNTGAALREGQELFFTGFPIGTVLGLIAATHRGMVSALTPISIPRSSATELDAAAIKRLSGSPYQVIQLDGTAYPGNSGSPLYDANGVVFGIINMVFVKGARENALSQPSGISYAIPSQPLAEMVAVHRR